MAVLPEALISAERRSREKNKNFLSGFSRILCPSPPLLLCEPNQNRHATPAKS